MYKGTLTEKWVLYAFEIQHPNSDIESVSQYIDSERKGMRP